MADPLTPLDDGREIAALVRRFYPLLLELAYQDAGDTLGMDLAFDLANPRVQDVLDQLAGQVQDISDTTRQAIQDLIGQGAAEGWGPDRLARAIRDAGITASASRADAISRTESATAYTQGSLLAYADSGVVAATEWLATDPCPICAPLAGQVSALGSLFPGGYSGPPAHPNCRCALAPVLQGAV